MQKKQQIGGVTLLILGIGLITFSLYRLYSYNDFKFFKQHTAVVADSSFVPTWNTGAPHGAGDANIILVEYAFRINGEVYKGNFYRVDRTNSTENNLMSEKFTTSESKSSFGTAMIATANNRIERFR